MRRRLNRFINNTIFHYYNIIVLSFLGILLIVILFLQGCTALKIADKSLDLAVEVVEIKEVLDAE